MSERRDEIASYLARVRMLLQARAEVRPFADLLPRGDLERVQVCIMRYAGALHAEMMRSGIKGPRLRWDLSAEGSAPAHRTHPRDECAEASADSRPGPCHIRPDGSPWSPAQSQHFTVGEFQSTVDKPEFE